MTMYDPKTSRYEYVDPDLVMAATSVRRTQNRLRRNSSCADMIDQNANVASYGEHADGAAVDHDDMEEQLRIRRSTATLRRSASIGRRMLFNEDGGGNEQSAAAAAAANAGSSTSTAGSTSAGNGRRSMLRRTASCG